MVSNIYIKVSTMDIMVSTMHEAQAPAELGNGSFLKPLTVQVTHQELVEHQSEPCIPTASGPTITAVPPPPPNTHQQKHLHNTDEFSDSGFHNPGAVDLSLENSIVDELNDDLFGVKCYSESFTHMG